MKLAECSTYDRTELTLSIMQYINNHIIQGCYRLGESSDVVLYECIHDALNRIDIYPVVHD